MIKFLKGLKYVVLTIVSFISVFPLYWMFSASTNTNLDVTKGRLLPGTAFLDNYYELLQTAPHLWTSMKNSLTYAVCVTFLSLLVSSLAGYGFEIYNDKYKDKVMFLLLTAMMVPFVAIMIPLFTLVSKLGLLNTAVGFVFPSIATPFLIMLFRQSSRSFPRDIIEAARIDGLGEVMIFFRAYIPIMRSTYAAAMTIVFMGAWNSYLWPKIIMTNGQTITMPMLITNLKTGYTLDYGVLMTAVCIGTIPTILIFFVLQKSFAEGIAGSVKG
ncbi:MAG: carbohydrate ABC transporter permease [Eubacteriales bacterium]